MRGDFTLQVGFFKGAAEEKDKVESPKGPDRVRLLLMCAEGVLCPGGTFKLFGEER